MGADPQTIRRASRAFKLWGHYRGLYDDHQYGPIFRSRQHGLGQLIDGMGLTGWNFSFGMTLLRKVCLEAVLCLPLRTAMVPSCSSFESCQLLQMREDMSLCEPPGAFCDLLLLYRSATANIVSLVIRQRKTPECSERKVPYSFGRYSIIYLKNASK